LSGRTFKGVDNGGFVFFSDEDYISLSGKVGEKIFNHKNELIIVIDVDKENRTITITKVK